MNRPRIALWIQLEGARIYPVLGGYRCEWWCPAWLWRWAVRRVDRWHAGDPLLVGGVDLPQWKAMRESMPDLTPEILEENIEHMKKCSVARSIMPWRR